MWIILLLIVSFQDQTPANLAQALEVSREQQQQPMGPLMVQLGLLFEGLPYEGGTLEHNDTEQLVVYDKGMDCFTFAENTLALALAGKRGGDFELFKQKLQQIRYRGGQIDGYPSRLHYTCDWGFDNGKKGFVRDVTAQIGGEPYTKTIEFMSTHRDAYKHLGNDANYKAIKDVERNINQRQHTYIPKAKLQQVESKIQEGDILALTTTIAGLDVVHVGLATFRDSRLHLLHASSTNKKVEVTAEPLADYLSGLKNRSGVMVFRPVVPSAQ